MSGGTRLFHATDWVFFAYMAVVSAVLAAVGAEGQAGFHAYHGLAATGIVLVAYAHRRWDRPFWRVLHHWYAALYIPAAFREQNYLSWTEPLRERRFDDILQALDHRLFGDVAGFCARLAHPLAVEIATLGYWCYFLLPVAVGLPLYRRDPAAFRRVACILVLAWLSSYLGYMAVPAVGPHHFELPRNSVLEGYGPAGLAHRALLAVEMEITDAFPSGHALATGLILVVAWQETRRVFWAILPFGLSLIVGTVYLRYHYAVDLVAAVPFAVFAYAAGGWLSRRVD